MAETGQHNLNFVETGKVLLEAAESRKKTMKSCGNRKIRKKSHGKPEKAGISCGNPETDPLLPPLLTKICFACFCMACLNRNEHPQLHGSVFAPE